MRTTSSHRWPLWLATVAMWFAALAPAVSHALARAGGDARWVEVCTAQGSRWVDIADLDGEQPAAPADAVAASLDHCPFCHLGHGMAPPPPAAPAPTAIFRDGLPSRPFTAPPTSPVWRAPPSRAPPVLS
ncbi:DUF2946 family protein [Azohydromonas sediminis]|uniref:DUF2946 family protein n=1 Tax=Azohydromonas sediminis TaxID=2259674 RepID=UPI0013C2C604|nr:DUF2946 family protein [Azohydromonas sediminis]